MVRDKNSKLIMRKKLIKSLPPQGLGELLSNSKINVTSNNLNFLENILGSTEKVLKTISNNLQYQKITRREAGVISYGALAGLSFSTGLLSILFNGCKTIPVEMNQPIDENVIIHYPRLPGQKIQSPEHYGLEGCMTSVWSAGLKPEYAINSYHRRVEKFPSILFLNYRNRSRLFAGIKNSKIEEMKYCAKNDIIPFITYDAIHYEGIQQTKKELKNIPKGKYDVEIIDSAKKLKKYGDEYGGFFIRTMREMTLPRLWPWAGNPKQFKNIWKHIWNIFEQEGTNKYATWVWNPYVADGYGPGKRYYPEDKYVDWIGLNGYNPVAHPNAENLSFSRLFFSAYKYFRDKKPNNPIMIAETGCPKINSKPQWVKDAFYSTKFKFSGIKALNWWDELWKDRNMGYSVTMDTRIDSSEKSLNAFKKAIENPYFLKNINSNKLFHLST